MSSVLFLRMPSHGHVNPTLGLVAELVRRGERVVYFAAEPFRERIEGADAEFRCYAVDLDIFKAPGQDTSDDAVPALLKIILDAPKVVGEILAQTAGERFDYLIHSATFLFAKPCAQIFKLPTIASFAVFLGLEGFFQKDQESESFLMDKPRWAELYHEAAQAMNDTFGVTLPPSPLELLMNEGDLNLLYRKGARKPPRLSGCDELLLPLPRGGW